MLYKIDTQLRYIFSNQLVLLVILITASGLKVLVGTKNTSWGCASYHDGLQDSDEWKHCKLEPHVETGITSVECTETIGVAYSVCIYGSATNPILALCEVEAYDAVGNDYSYEVIARLKSIVSQFQ